MMKKTLVSIACILLLAGCSTSLDKIVQQLGKDKATAIGKVTTLQGNGYFIRSNPETNQDVSITPDGAVTIKSH